MGFLQESFNTLPTFSISRFFKAMVVMGCRSCPRGQRLCDILWPEEDLKTVGYSGAGCTLANRTSVFIGSRSTENCCPCDHVCGYPCTQYANVYVYNWLYKLFPRFCCRHAREPNVASAVATTSCDNAGSVMSEARTGPWHEMAKPWTWSNSTSMDSMDGYSRLQMGVCKLFVPNIW